MPIGSLGLFAFSFDPILQASIRAHGAAGIPDFRAGSVAPGGLCSFHHGSPGWSVSGALGVRVGDLSGGGVSAGVRQAASEPKTHLRGAERRA